MPGDTNRDSANVAIAVGDTVNIVGTVSAINLVDNRFNDVEVTLSHPVAGVIPPVGLEVNNGEIGARKKVYLPASVVTKV
jgi:hypothetical protein